MPPHKWSHLSSNQHYYTDIIDHIIALSHFSDGEIQAQSTSIIFLRIHIYDEMAGPTFERRHTDLRELPETLQLTTSFALRAPGQDKKH